MKKTSKIKKLIFDADDTLWENNIYYINAGEDFVNLISKSGLSKEKIKQDFRSLERKVVKEMGYGSQNYLYLLRTVFEQYAPVINIKDISPKFEEICSEFESHSVPKRDPVGIRIFALACQSCTDNCKDPFRPGGSAVADGMT